MDCVNIFVKDYRQPTWEATVRKAEDIFYKHTKEGNLKILVLTQEDCRAHKRDSRQVHDYAIGTQVAVNLADRIVIELSDGSPIIVKDRFPQ